jgi:hypothetical protein
LAVIASEAKQSLICSTLVHNKKYKNVLKLANITKWIITGEDREEDPIQKKLAYIRHDNLPMGDNYGAWYHFFGISMYALMRSGLTARAVAEIESFGSFFLEGADKQEDYINRYGAIFGRKLKKMIKSKSWREPLPKGARTDYMLPDLSRRQKN